MNWNIAGLTLLIVFFGSLFTTQAQELNCKVEINYQRLQSADPQIFETLETAVFEFMNNRRWTKDKFAPQEKIDCTIFINITDEKAEGVYGATATIQSSRPVYNSSYQTVLLNFTDRDWIFEYAQFQNMEYNPNAFISNLTSMLAFYAHLIIGLDYETFSPNGGTEYFEKAFAIVNNVPSNLGDNAPGWTPFESQRNRYWIIENVLNPRYAPIRESIYQFHLQGLDKFYEDKNSGRQVILNSLKKMEAIVSQFPNAMLVQLFFSAKRDELVSMFSSAPQNQKQQAIQSLYKLDPTHAEKYRKILTR